MAPYDGMVCPLLLRTASHKLSFQWQSSPDLLASSYGNNNTICILQQWLSERTQALETDRRRFEFMVYVHILWYRGKVT